MASGIRRFLLDVDGIGVGVSAYISWDRVVDFVGLDIWVEKAIIEHFIALELKLLCVGFNEPIANVGTCMRETTDPACVPESGATSCLT